LSFAEHIDPATQHADRRALVDADAEVTRLQHECASQPCFTLALPEVLIEDHTFEQAEAVPDLGLSLAARDHHFALDRSAPPRSRRSQRRGRGERRALAAPACCDRPPPGATGSRHRSTPRRPDAAERRTLRGSRALDPECGESCSPQSPASARSGRIAPRSLCSCSPLGSRRGAHLCHRPCEERPRPALSGCRHRPR
jgi:hypothetical protein